MTMLIKCTVLCSVLILAPACSIKRVAVNKLGNALASSGTTFESDNDPELVAAAVPFGLKLYESLLEESPKHPGLLLAAASGFTEYSYAFVDARIDEAKEDSLEHADELRDRARKLYLRAYGYGMRGLEARYPGIGKGLDDDAEKALKRVRKRDVPLLYWTAASRGLAISLSTDNPQMLAELPLIETIVKRVSELDEGFDNGAVPEFLITLTSAHMDLSNDEQQKLMRQYFDQAIELSHGKRAGTFVSLAEKAAVPKRDGAEFKELLWKALAIETEAEPEDRLANLVAQRRARWLLKHFDDLFPESKGQ